MLERGVDLSANSDIIGEFLLDAVAVAGAGGGTAFTRREGTTFDCHAVVEENELKADAGRENWVREFTAVSSADQLGLSCELTAENL